MKFTAFNATRNVQMFTDDFEEAYRFAVNTLPRRNLRETATLLNRGLVEHLYRVFEARNQD